MGTTLALFTNKLKLKDFPDNTNKKYGFIPFDLNFPYNSDAVVTNHM